MPELQTNPVPLEKIIDEDPHVKMSIMFGQGKFQNGLLIEPAEGLSVDPNDPQQVAAFRNAIWYVLAYISVLGLETHGISKADC